jgi:hypothetical protein
MVIDLTVKSNNGVAVGAAHGLVATGEIDNSKPRSAKGDVGRGETALLIGSAMRESRDSSFQNAW